MDTANAGPADRNRFGLYWIGFFFIWNEGQSHKPDRVDTAFDQEIFYTQMKDMDLRKIMRGHYRHDLGSSPKSLLDISKIDRQKPTGSEKLDAILRNVCNKIRKLHRRVRGEDPDDLFALVFSRLIQRYQRMAGLDGTPDRPDRRLIGFFYDQRSLESDLTQLLRKEQPKEIRLEGEGEIDDRAPPEADVELHLRVLTPQERRVICAKFGIGQDRIDGNTLASQMRLSPGRISQISMAALEKMRKKSGIR